MPPVTAAPCRGCGSRLPAKTYRGNPRVWCSERCRARTLRTGTGVLVERTCEWCAEHFVPSRSDKKFCSGLCCRRAQDARAAARRAALRDVPPRPCERCGTVFTPTPNNNRARFCRDQCQKYASKLRHRARLADARVESFPLVEIFERDGWICQLCDEPIERDMKPPHPWGPSIDHRVPLALGGAHSRGNCQAAHYWCNCAKKHREDFTFKEAS